MGRTGRVHGTRTRTTRELGQLNKRLKCHNGYNKVNDTMKDKRDPSQDCYSRVEEKENSVNSGRKTDIKSDRRRKQTAREEKTRRGIV